MEMVLYPKSEIDTRIDRLQRQMGELTGAILFQSVDMCYFSGTAQEGLVYIPRESDPIVMIRKSLERAKQESPLNVIALRSLKTIKMDLGITPGSVIGLELDVLPYNNYSRVQHILDDAKIVDISEKIKHIRSVKSEFEIDLIKEASKMVDTGIASVEEHLKEGMSEIELAGKVEAVMRSLGHQGTLHFRRFNHELHFGHIMSGPDAAIPSFVASPNGGRGVSLLHPQGAGFKKIKRNEPLLVDYAGIYNGYIADETRIFSIGKIPQDLEDAHIASLEIQKAISNELSPGRTGRELFNLSEAKGLLLGYENQLGGPPGNKCGFVGHGVGLEIDDYPILGPVDHQIQPSMTIAIEPKMIYPGIGVVGIEDTFLTTTERAERLTRLPQEIWRL
ncbi:MAG: Xaa-Pro peptidase family protein [Methanotrichaceae archaeon]|nr:Xaa-Pro peptidase family protein [Methanotrichaceae archaeon]